MLSYTPRLFVLALSALSCTHALPEEVCAPSSCQEEAKAPARDSIAAIEELIASTPPGSPEYPDLLFRYAEVLEERATGLKVESFALQDQTFAERDPAAREGLKERAAALAEEAKKLSSRAHAQYIAILQGYPDYARRDEVLYAAAFSYQQQKEPQKALDLFRELIKQYPASRFYPEALLSLAEYFFSENQIEDALKTYQKLEAFPDSSVYGYALYKQGWCYFNLSYFPEAMQKFIEVAEVAREKGEEGQYKTLRKEALRDMARVYARFGAPGDARALFLKVGGEEYLAKMLLWLARYYEELGKSGEAGVICLEYRALEGVLEECS